MNERAAWAQMEAAEAREAARELEWERADLKRFLPESQRADSLRPFEPVYTHEQLSDALLALHREYTQ